MSVENEVAHCEYQLIFHIENEPGLLVLANIKLIEFFEIFCCENGVLMVLEVVVAFRNDEPDLLGAKLHLLEFDLIMVESKIGEIYFLKGLGLWVIGVQQILVLGFIGIILLVEVKDIMSCVDLVDTLDVSSFVVYSI